MRILAVLIAIGLSGVALPSAEAITLTNRDGKTIEAEVTNFEKDTGHIAIQNETGQAFIIPLSQLDFPSQLAVLTSAVTLEQLGKLELSLGTQLRFHAFVTALLVPFFFCGYYPLSALVLGSWNPINVGSGFLKFMVVSILGSVVSDVALEYMGDSIVGLVIILAITLVIIFATLLVLKTHHHLSSLWKAFGLYIGISFLMPIVAGMIGIFLWIGLKDQPQFIEGADAFVTSQVFAPLGWVGE